jgi:NADH:ubiquinone oxidoreductase subunit F (NADH-binding)
MLPEHALSKDAHFAIVPFLSRNSIAVPRGRISLTKNGLGFATFRFEVPVQNYADVEHKTMGVVGALLKDSAGGILKGWPIIAVRNGSVERIPDNFEP